MPITNQYIAAHTANVGTNSAAPMYHASCMLYTIAQKPKVFAAIQVYILLIKLYFTVLAYRSPLKTFDAATEVWKDTNIICFICYWMRIYCQKTSRLFG
jgi:hypothetical protein